MFLVVIVVTVAMTAVLGLAASVIAYVALPHRRAAIGARPPADRSGRPGTRAPG
jgi:hypothetical protein